MADQINPLSEIATVTAAEHGAENSAPHRQFQLHTKVDAEFLDALEAELVETLHARFMAYRERYMQSRMTLSLLLILKCICILGLALCVWVFALGGIPFHGIRIEFLFALFFLILLVLFWDKNKLINRQGKVFKPYWSWLAKSHAKRMLKVARKILPFEAEYVFRDDVAVYYRISKAGSTLAWNRKVKHCYLSGQRATMLFKKPTSLYPYVLIQHDPPAALAAYLDEIGLRAIA
ncbi:hypothetical protein [Undibacterium sp. TJN19]|uniref:hypothetical protein n=1 Tax=Undibacterium sp. TJN19 TaxID=3413055 RepID=UPI003BF2462B